MTTVVVHGPVAEGSAGASGPARLASARAVAARCLAAAARRAGAGHVEVLRDERGAPRSACGRALSFAGARGLAAAGISPRPLGIDVERLDRVRLRPARESALPDELRLAGDGAEDLLLLWTAKEAVLKKLGVGLAGLSRCRLVDVERGEARAALALLFDGDLHAVRSRRLPAHWISVASADPALELRSLEEALP